MSRKADLWRVVCGRRATSKPWGSYQSEIVVAEENAGDAEDVRANGDVEYICRGGHSTRTQYLVP